ncbi:serine hydrolase domain-containing protein [Enterococcus sp. LJL99]
MTLEKIQKDFSVPDYFVGTFGNNEENYYGNVNHSFNLCSISKLVTTLLCLKLIAQKKILLTDKLNQELDLSIDSITVEDILRHLSGIQDKETDFLPNVFPESRTFLKEITKTAVGEFAYSDQGFMLLQYWLEEKMNLPFQEIMQQEIFLPLNCHSFNYFQQLTEINSADLLLPGYNQNNQIISNNYSCYPYPAACGLWGNGKDVLTLMKEITKGLNSDSHLGIPQDIYRFLITPKTESWIGLGCFLDDTKLGIELSSLGWGVGYQAMVISLPNQQEALVTLTNKDSGKNQMESFCGATYRTWHSEPIFSQA